MELLDKIMPKGRAMILAYDQGFEHGPRDFIKNPESKNPGYIINIARKGNFTSLVLHAGLAEKYYNVIKESGIPLILKLNGKSEIYTQDDPYSPQLYSVKDAIGMGASAVGYTVYTGSKWEYLMNKEFAAIIREAHNLGIPAIGWMYPRGLSIDERKSSSKTLEIAVRDRKSADIAIDETSAIVAYGARIGLELGADVVKVKYTGSIESYRYVVENAAPTKVVMSGGPATNTDEEFLSIVNSILQAGAAGIAVGRNVWQRNNPLIISKKLHSLIFTD